MTNGYSILIFALGFNPRNVRIGALLQDVKLNTGELMETYALMMEKCNPSLFPLLHFRQTHPIFYKYQ